MSGKTDTFPRAASDPDSLASAESNQESVYLYLAAAPPREMLYKIAPQATQTTRAPGREPTPARYGTVGALGEAGSGWAGRG